MSQTINGLSNPNAVNFNAALQELSAMVSKTGNTVVPGAGESLSRLTGQVRDPLLPQLAAPTTTDTSKATGLAVGGLSLGGLSLETMMDAVGMEQRRTETKTGVANLEARAQERADANTEKVKQVQEEVDKAKSQGFLDGLLKAFKYIGMALAAIGSIAMIAAGAVGLAAGGAGAALIAVGVTSLFLLADSITQEASGGKAGFGPGFIAGKIAESCGASESTAQWIQFALDLATSIALAAVGGAAAAGKLGGSVAKVASDTATAVTQTAAKAASTAAEVASKTATSAQKFAQAAAMTAKISTIAGGVNTVAQSATSIGAAVNERDIDNLQASQKRLQAILERIAQANDLDLEHIKAMMQRSEETLQTVSDIVQEGAQTNIAIMTGSPAMA